MLDNSWHKNICVIIKHEIFVIEKDNNGVRDDIHIKSEWMKDMSVNDCKLKWRKHDYILW